MREEFNAKISEIPEENIVYIDESGFDVNMKKEYGWSARGKKIMGDKSGKRGKRISVIAGLINRKHLIAPTCFLYQKSFEIRLMDLRARLRKRIFHTCAKSRFAKFIRIILNDFWYHSLFRLSLTNL